MQLCQLICKAYKISLQSTTGRNWIMSMYDNIECTHERSIPVSCIIRCEIDEPAIIFQEYVQIH